MLLCYASILTLLLLGMASLTSDIRSGLEGLHTSPAELLSGDDKAPILSNSRAGVAPPSLRRFQRDAEASSAVPTAAAAAAAASASKSVLGVFTAGGSWDPVFVMAPARLVGLQNEAAARERGQKRARQVAWHRIDGPEVRSRGEANMCCRRSATTCGGAGKGGGAVGACFVAWVLPMTNDHKDTQKRKQTCVPSED